MVSNNSSEPSSSMQGEKRSRLSQGGYAGMENKEPIDKAWVRQMFKDFKVELSDLFAPTVTKVMEHDRQFEGLAKREANSKWVRQKSANLKINIS
jgi:hypothetical protein